MSLQSNPTAFWCSRCRTTHAGECPPAPPPVDRSGPGPDVDIVYFRKGGSTLARPRTDADELDRLRADGWVEFDPNSPPGKDCFATLVTHKGPLCRHVTSWWCPKAAEAMRAKYGTKWTIAKAAGAAARGTP